MHKINFVKFLTSHSETTPPTTTLTIKLCLVFNIVVDIIDAFYYFIAIRRQKLGFIEIFNYLISVKIKV